MLITWLAQETTTTGEASWEFVQEGTFWLALAGIIATATTAIYAQRSNNKRAADDRDFQEEQRQADREHNENMLRFQLDRERGIGQHDSFLKQIDQIDDLLEPIAMSLNEAAYWTPEGMKALYNRGLTDDAFKEPTGSVAMGIYSVTNHYQNTRKAAMINEKLEERGWTEPIREAANELNIAFGDLEDALQTIAEAWATLKENPDTVWKDQDMEAWQKDLERAFSLTWSNAHNLRMTVAQN